jgi:hypothetical protein
MLHDGTHDRNISFFDGEVSPHIIGDHTARRHGHHLVIKQLEKQIQTSGASEVAWERELDAVDAELNVGGHAVAQRRYDEIRAPHVIELSVGQEKIHIEVLGSSESKELVIVVANGVKTEQRHEDTVGVVHRSRLYEIVDEGLVYRCVYSTGRGLRSFGIRGLVDRRVCSRGRNK